MSAPRLPSTLADRPFDPQRGVPIPFVHEADDGSYDLSSLNGRRAVQCALSRVCAMCAQSLGYPLAFLGDREEAEAHAYAYPPMHLSCAEAAVRLYPPPARDPESAVGPGSWVLTVTGGYEVERPTRRGEPMVFRPHPGEVRGVSGADPA